MKTDFISTAIENNSILIVKKSYSGIIAKIIREGERATYGQPMTNVPDALTSLNHELSEAEREKSNS